MRIQSTDMKVLVAIAAAWLAVMPTATDAQIKRWVDKNGKVHYGDVPPPEQETETVKITPNEGFSQDDVKAAQRQQRLDALTRERERATAARREQLDQQIERQRKELLAHNCARIRLIQDQHHRENAAIRQGSTIRTGDPVARDQAYERREQWLRENCK